MEEELSDDKDPHDVSTFVSGVARKLTEQENIRKSIGERQSEPTIPWPEKPHIFGLRSLFGSMSSHRSSIKFNDAHAQ